MWPYMLASEPRDRLALLQATSSSPMSCTRDIATLIVDWTGVRIRQSPNHRSEQQQNPHALAYLSVAAVAASLLRIVTFHSSGEFYSQTGRRFDQRVNKLLCDHA